MSLITQFEIAVFFVKLKNFCNAILKYFLKATAVWPFPVVQTWCWTTSFLMCFTKLTGKYTAAAHVGHLCQFCECYQFFFLSSSHVKRKLLFLVRYICKHKFSSYLLKYWGFPQVNFALQYLSDFSEKSVISFIHFFAYCHLKQKFRSGTDWSEFKIFAENEKRSKSCESRNSSWTAVWRLFYISSSYWIEADKAPTNFCGELEIYILRAYG